MKAFYVAYPKNLKMKKITIEQYNQLHPNLITPLDLKIDVKLFNKEILQYVPKFRRWGITHTEYPRFGISLCNLTGRIDDEVDPACWPLDTWARYYPNQKYNDNDFKKQTVVLELSSLAPIQQLQKHLIRSNLLLWHKGGRFVPHVDVVPSNIISLRLWGVNVDDSKYALKYQDGVIRGFEPGRLYLINTMKLHDAIALANDVYTFFIAVDLDAQPLIESLMLTKIS